jgi:SM-20-related protein
VGADALAGTAGRVAADERHDERHERHDELWADGIAVRDGFACEARVLQLLGCVNQRAQRGEFAISRVGGLGRAERREDLRGDATCWLEEPYLPAERGLLDDLERLRLQLNHQGFLGLFDLELHYARYPAGAGYARHVDQPQGRGHRQVSFILYLNSDWQPEHGGELRLFHADGTHRDIAPMAGRLVYFLTAGREHAVLPTQRERYSVCGWFRCRE